MGLKRFFMARDFGLLLMRIALGMIMIVHGIPKFIGGAEVLTAAGKAMAHLGVHFGFLFWGLMAAFTEVVGGVLLIAGFLFRLTCLSFFLVMMVATVSHLAVPDPKLSSIDYWNFIAAHPFSLGMVYLSLIFIGPGRFSAQKE